MAEKKQTDLFTNMLVQSLTMSAINTLTFGEINVGVNLFDKAALILNRLEWTLSGASLADLDTDSDTIAMGLSSSSNIGSDNPDQPEVIDRVAIQRCDAGAAAAMLFVYMPLVHDFGSMPGGGLLIPASPLYMFLTSAGMTVVGVTRMRLFFTILRLEGEQYLELLQARRAFS